MSLRCVREHTPKSITVLLNARRNSTSRPGQAQESSVNRPSGINSQGACMASETSKGEQGKEVETVPAAHDPKQQQERDVTAHQGTVEEEAAAAKIEEVLRKLQPLCARSPQLLGPAGPHGVVTGDTGQRCLAFMETELSIVVAFLTTLSPQHLDGETKKWLEIPWLDVHRLVDRVSDEVGPSRHTLLRRASECFHRRKSDSYLLPSYTAWLYYMGASRYRHLLLTSSDLGLTPQLAEAEAKAGAPPLVGIDRPAKKILRWLAQQSHQGTMDRSLSVMSIVGPVGIGKTALAVELRNRLMHETSGGCYDYFQCNVMAQVPRGTDRNILLLQDILSQVSEPAAATALSSDPSSQAKTMEVLVHLVSECLRDKRYFIIIDGIREASDWEKIKGAFPNNNIDSRILITTRSTSIAWTCCSDSYDGLVHKMKPLNEIDSERLLLTKVVGSVDGCLPDNMRLFCDEILSRCDGIPLFITAIADWLIKEQLQQQQQQQGVIDEDEEHESFATYCEGQVPKLPERLEQSLSSAFNNDFPNNELRLLLLYMSMFPYGYKFYKDRLIRKWISEGLVSSLEAETFFSHLVDMNVMTCVAANCKHSNVDQAETSQWQVNHFMHQFLASKSAEMGFVFTTTTLKLVAAASTATGHGDETRGKVPRSLVLHHPDPQLSLLLETIDLSQTRSLSVSGTVSRIPLDKFVNLVVLDLEGWENLKDEDLLQVCRSKMIFLTYLSVRNTRVSKLPNEIKELRSLDTLDISCTQITELPLQVFELKFLRHLDLRGTWISQLPKLPNDVRHLYRLQTLATTVDFTEQPPSFIRALRDLQRLKVLAFTWSFHQSPDRDYCNALLSSIENRKNLESLTIHCGLGCSMEFLGSLQKFRARGLKKFKVTAGRFTSVPPWIHGLRYLVFVQITVCNKQTTTDDLKILGDLPELQCLILGLDFIPGQAIVIENEGFSKLQRFSVDCPMPWLTFTAGSMRKLTYLQLKLCAFPASNTEVPSGIGDLPSLSEVALCYNVRYANNPYVKETVKAVREAVAEHLNQVDLFINGIQDFDVQAVHEVTENAATGTLSSTDAGARDDAQAQPVAEETASAAVQSEITTEAES